MLLRLWKAEIDQDAVAQILRDKSIIFADHRDAGLAILTQQPDQVLRIQLPSERGGADQVYEYDGDLATLDLRWLRSRLTLRRCNRRRGRPKLGSGGNEFTAVTERQPQFFQVLLGQVRCYREVNVVACEDFAVFLEAQALQPDIEI